MNVDEALELVETLPSTEVEYALAAEVRRLRAIEQRVKVVARGRGFCGSDEAAIARWILGEGR